MTNFQPITSRIDSAEIQKIKNTLAFRERQNAEQYEQMQFDRRNPQVVFQRTQTTAQGADTLVGLKYPLEVDGSGGLVLSSNATRVREQILEVLETRIGERILRPFFGLPELIFETVDENSLAQTIKTKILDSITIPVDLDVATEVAEDGTTRVGVSYSVEGSEATFINYSFSP